LEKKEEAVDDGPADEALPESKTGWKCIFNGNVMYSDGFFVKKAKMEPLFEGSVMQVKA
tara:strand:- start:449 stop:625 length:177 start_codon:yes stop_codon:yes gene_type:complete